MDLGQLPDWVPISQAYRIATELFGDREKANYQLLKALRENKIRNKGTLEDWSDKTVYKDIHLNLDDFVGWLVQYGAKVH